MTDYFPCIIVETNDDITKGPYEPLLGPYTLLKDVIILINFIRQ